MFTFVLGQNAGGWHVQEVRVDRTGAPSEVHVRGDAWRLNAGVDDIAAVLIYLRLRAISGHAPVLDAETGPSERGLAERCHSIHRTAGDRNTKWIRRIFGEPGGADSDRANPLGKMLSVTNRRAPRVRLQAGRSLDEFEFLVGDARAPVEHLEAFIRAMGPEQRVGGEGVSSPDAWLLGRVRAERALLRDNPSAMPVLAICGGRTEAKNLDLLDYLVEKLADWLPAMSVYHIVSGWESIGLEVLHEAARKHPAAELSYSVFVGSASGVVAFADLVLVLGGEYSTWIEVMAAEFEGKVILPVGQTGGCAQSTADRFDKRAPGQLPRWWQQLRRAERHTWIWKTIEVGLFDMASSRRKGGRAVTTVPAGRTPSDAPEG